MKLNFNISDFCISGTAIPQEVADKILEFHILPMQVVRDRLGIKIWPSAKSGYRPVSWELSKGRSGNSQHTFKGKGAVDWTCEDFDVNQTALLSILRTSTDYTRIAVYKTFIHCDYKPTKSGKREVYVSSSNSNWMFYSYAIIEEL